MEITERELQAKILKLIRSEELSGAIVHSDDIEHLSAARDENCFASFSIDHMVRESCARAAAHALQGLSMLEVLTEDLNVSATSGEILRPDIVCYNAEQHTLVIFELKKSNQTGRQALTELLAYEQELKNTLPFLSNYDTIFVLISTEWSTLMDHSAASAVAWSGKNLLCLEANLENGKLSLNPRLPKAWRITGSSHFPAESLPTVTICLYDYNPPADGLEHEPQFDIRLLTAVDLIAREGDRIGGHGFLLVWRDHSDVSLTTYNITVCGVSPFAFYKAMRLRNNIQSRDGHLIDALDTVITEFDPNGQSASLYKAMEAGMPLLNECSRPHYEGLHYWETDEEMLRGRAIPLRCDFWGLPGIFARDFIADPAVRKHRKGWLKSSDWRDPRIGIAILRSLLEPDAFHDGHVRCSDCFKLGLALGRDLALRAVRAKNESRDSRVDCLLTWGFYELSALMEEVRLLANAATNVKPPDAPFRIVGDASSDDATFSEPLVQWISTEFLQASAIHTMFFEIGLNATFAYDSSVRRLLPDEWRRKSREDQKNSFVQAYVIVLMVLATSEKDGGLLENDKLLKRTLLQTLSINPSLGIKKAIEEVKKLGVPAVFNGWTALLDLADGHIPPVFHQHSDVAPANPDWNWLKQGIDEMRERGVPFPAVHLQANGALTTGPIGQQGVEAMGDVSDPETEVLFSDHSHGILVVKKTSWAELKAGKHFAVRSSDSPGRDK